MHGDTHRLRRKLFDAYAFRRKETVNESNEERKD